MGTTGFAALFIMLLIMAGAVGYVFFIRSSLSLTHTHSNTSPKHHTHTVDECWTEWASRDLQGAMVPHLNKFLFPERPGISSHVSSVYDLRNAFLKDEKVVTVRGVAQVLTQILLKSSSRARTQVLRVAEERLKGRTYFTNSPTMSICDVIVACAMYYPFAFLITRKERESTYPNLLRHFLSCMRIMFPQHLYLFNHHFL